MRIQITITPTDLDEAQQILARIGAQAAGVTIATPATEPQKRTRRTKAEIEADAARKAEESKADPAGPQYHIGGQPIAGPGETLSKPAAPEQPQIEDAKIVSETTAALDYERDVKPIVAKLAGDPVTLKQVVAVLGKYGAKRGQDVKVEDLAAFKADIEKIGAEEPSVL